MRIDPHVHSKYSKRPSQWILKKIGCSESFAEPMEIYHLAMRAGMTHVTITDHNVVDGALSIAHMPGTFVSEEVTTYFPEDGCKIHVLALDINEAQHREIQSIRENIFDLSAYLYQENIFNIVAHPLYAINDRLTVDHFEQLLLLFKHFELNGARNDRENTCLKMVIRSLTPEKLARLTEKHDMVPLYSDPWEKVLFGGSDDHSALNICRTYTEIINHEDDDVFSSGLTVNDVKVHSTPATPLTMAHNLYGIGYQFYREKFKLQRYQEKDILLQFLDRSLRPNVSNGSGLVNKFYSFLYSQKVRYTKLTDQKISDSLMALLRQETQKLFQMHPELLSLDSVYGSDPDSKEKKWFEFVRQITNSMMAHFVDHLMNNLSGANVFNIFHTIGAAGGLYTLLVPYFVSYTQFTKDRVFSETIQERFRENLSESSDTSAKKPVRVAHFTDTFYAINGVALTLQQQVKTALKTGKQLTIITCDTDHPTDMAGIKNFRPIGEYEIPEYPEQKLYYPPLLDMLEFCYEQKITHIHTATPGPLGLAALAISKILKLPLSGTYHTAIPQYARALTGDAVIEDLTWKYTMWFYDQMDVVYVPSKSTGEELAQKGIDSKKIRIYPRGIDVSRFHPRNRNGILKKHFHVDQGTVLLYVGRVSKEKNLHLLEKTFRRISEVYDDVVLLVIGNGPYLEEMKQNMADLPCVFPGYMEGEALAAAYASSDIFVFPSVTDTFGNVVLEAQASNIPVIVTDQGGPCENMVPGITGIMTPGDDEESLCYAVRHLLDNPEQRLKMGHAARKYMEDRSFEATFIKTWEMFRDPLPVQVS